MITYGYRLDNITVSYNTTTSYGMTTPNYSEEVNDAVSAAVGILTPATPNLVIPVDPASISTSTSSTLAPSESSISQPASYSFPDPNVLVLTTFSTTTVPYTDPVVQVPTQPTTDNVTTVPVSTSLLYGFPIAVTLSSTIDIAPSVTILPTIPPTAPLLLNSTSLTSFPTLTPSYINPTTLETLSSTPPSKPTPPPPTTSSSSSSSTNNPASTTSTIPQPTTSRHSSSNSVGVYVGAAIGGALSLILLICVIFCLLRRRKRKHPKHHPDRPAFIGGYELKLDKVGDLQRVVHEKRVRRHTFEAWKRGVVPDIDPDDVAGKSEVHVTGGTPLTGYSNSLDEVAEDVPVSEANKEGGLVEGEAEASVEDGHDEYVVSPIEEQREETWPEVEEQKAGRPISGIIPLIFQWEKRADQKGYSATGTIGQAT
ncbi:hypothetical protein OCU04_004745 [Sclerotinia nivalis]|uniref:Uncharacterized protein n=1 Tax=Sclerotinia nivalis TaxID=352851 RepID=A0A9X0AUF4_9HELO|nr:hypothetical protein OCU04_004745 [Sclerotinia nivalis]